MIIMEKIPEDMKNLYKRAKDMIIKADTTKIYSHIDCDGISAGAILSILLDRLNKPHEIEFVNLDRLDDLELNHDLTIFSDLGSGQPVNKNIQDNQKIIILDHHPPLRNKQTPQYLEINPHHFNIDGSYDICGGGLCYLLAKEFGFKDLSWIGVLAAVGDMQNSRTGKLEGLNKIVLDDAIATNSVKLSENDLLLYGRETRPLFVALSYFSDVNLPLTNNRTESIALLKELEIPRKVGSRNRTLCDLTFDEKGRLYNKLIEMLAQEVPPKYVPYVPRLIIGDSYEFVKEEPHSFLRDAAEFSTAMNACGRNDEFDVALEILKGDRYQALDMLEVVTKEHKRNLAQSIKEIEEEDSIIELKNIQYFQKDYISTVGTIAGMILSYGNWKKPIIGFSKTDEEHLKVSLRCSRLLAYDGIHFGNIIRSVSQELGGNGGGHSVACGAFIPISKKDEFLNKFNKELEGKIAE